MTLNIKKTFNLTNKYIVLATPLILFSLLSNMYALFSVSNKLISIIFTLILLCLMSGAFFAGWLVMIKKAVADEYPNNPNMLIKDFVSGVGEYFLSTTGALFCTSLFVILILTLSFALGNYFIGDIGITSEQLAKAMESTNELKLFLTSLSVEQMAKIQQWNILILGSMFLSCFLLTFYYPTIFYKNKNPFVALFISLKDLFSRKFFIIFCVIFFVLSFYLFLSAFSTITSQNIVLHFISTLANFYFMVFFTLWVFDFYNRNFVLSHLGQNIDETV